MEAISERPGFRANGFVMVLFSALVIVAQIYVLIELVATNDLQLLWGFGALFLAFVLLTPGFFVVQPNEARVLVFFGRYIGTVKESGFWWTNPFTIKRHVSLRIHNFNSERIKVNDHAGNPIEIAAVVVWRVVDSARALFDVESYENFVAIQSETAIRNLAAEYPYDTHEEASASLRGSPQEVAESLKAQLQKRLEIAGVTVLESRLSHLAYAAEIAQAMLRRQQAQAIVAARQKIVEGAVGMVEMALRALSEQKIIVLDEEKKATMVNNLMVALVADREAQPVINTGTLYS